MKSSQIRVDKITHELFGPWAQVSFFSDKTNKQSHIPHIHKNISFPDLHDNIIFSKWPHFVLLISIMGRWVKKTTQSFSY